MEAAPSLRGSGKIVGNWRGILRRLPHREEECEHRTLRHDRSSRIG
jgi:hypothetical protein